MPTWSSISIQWPKTVVLKRGRKLGLDGWMKKLSSTGRPFAFHVDLVLISLLRPFDSTREHFGPFDPKAISYPHAHNMMSMIWTYRTLYTIQHEYFNSQLFSVAAFRVSFDPEFSPLQLQTFIRACQGLYELSKQHPVARDVLASLQVLIARQKLHISPYVQNHLNVEVDSPGESIMQLTVVPILMQAEGSVQSVGGLYGLMISDLIATREENVEPD